MTRTTKQIEIAHPLSADPQHLPRLPASTSLSKPQRPKSKSLQPCRCSHEGCGKMFSKRSNLKAHMRVHSGVLPYPCHFPGCTKRFRWKSSLKPHIRVHLASGHASTPTFSSNTATSTELLTTTTHTLNHTEIAQPRAASALKPVLTEQLLEMHSKGLIFDRRDQPIDQSPTAINAPDVLGISYEMEQRQEVRRRIDNGPVYPLNKPAVARVLFQDSHEHSDTHDQGEIDLSTESVLSSSATSYETDVVSFSFDSPMEESHESTTDNTLTEHLWKSDIQVMDPFEGLSMDGGESNIEFLSGFDRNNGISATSLEGNPTDSQWMFSSAGSTVSSAEFTTTLNSLSI